MLDTKYNNQDILFFSIIDWDSKPQRPQHIVFQLSKNHRIFYFNVNFIETDTKVFTTKNLCNIYRIVLSNIIGENLYYANLEKNMLNMSIIIDNIIKQYNIKDATIVVESPNWYPIVTYINNKYNFKILFDYIEDYPVSIPYNDTISKYNKLLLRYSDFIIAASQLLYEKACIGNFNVRMVDNETEPSDKLAESDKNHGWSERASNINDIIKKMHPLVSIIIVTYNKVEYTKQCIKSILEKTAYPNYEIVIVDNASNDETKDYLKELENKYSNIKVIINDENFGFAKANNIGIKNSNGYYIILLNNDTLVTKGWVSWMLKYFDRDPNVGMVGPVTNAIGNEAKINVSYTEIDAMDSFAKDYTFSHINETYSQIKVLAMFCVCFKRELIDKIGYLDEGFGIGMFEDDDFSERVKHNNYKLICLEDVFIHHFGSASFKEIEYEKYVKLFVDNRKRFERIWNITWVPHKHRSGVK